MNMQSDTVEHPLFIPAVLRDGHSKQIMNVSIHNNFAATSSKDNSVSVWNLDNQSTLFVGQFTEPVAGAFLCSPSSLVVGFKSGRIVCWDTVKFVPLYELAPPENVPFNKFFASSEYVVTMVEDKAYVYRGTEFMLLITGEGVKYTDITMHESFLGLAREDGMVEVWDLHDESRIGFIVAHAEGVKSFALTPFHLVTAGHDETIAVWDLVSFAEIHRFAGVGPITVLEAFPDRILVGSEHGVAKIWSLQDFELKATLLGHLTTLTAACISDKGIITGDETGEVRFWDPILFRELRMISPARPIQNIAANRDLIAIYDGISVEVYEFPAEKPSFVITPPTGNVDKLMFIEESLVLTDKKKLFSYDLAEFKPIKLLKKIKPKDIIPSD